MDHSYFVSIHRALFFIENNAWWAKLVLHQLQFYRMELRFIERFFRWAALWASNGARIWDISTNIHFLKYKFRNIWTKEGNGLAARLSQIRTGHVTDWHLLAWELKEKLHKSKLEIKAWCQGLPSRSLTRDPATSDEILILLDAILHNLKDLLRYKAGITVLLNDPTETLEGKLVFLHNFLQLTANCENNMDFQDFKDSVRFIANNAACQTFLYWVRAPDEGIPREIYLSIEMDLMLSDMLQKIEPCMPDVMAMYYQTLRYQYSTSYEIRIFINAILDNLKNLARYKTGNIVPLQKKIDTLEQKLLFLQNFLKLAENCVDSVQFQIFMAAVHLFSEKAAHLTVLCWLKAGDERIVTEMNVMLSDMLPTINPYTPYVTALYFETLKAIKLQRSNTHLLGQTVVIFVDLFIENLAIAPSKDDFVILQEELVFVLTFLADPPEEVVNDGELTLVLEQIDALLKEGCYLVSPLDDMEEIFERKVHNFLQKIETVNGKIRQLYCELPYSYLHDFPRIIGRGFPYFLIQNLRNLKEKLISETTCAPFAKNSIMKIEEELVSLRPFFNDILELQNEQKEQSDTWLEVINLLYLTEHVINSCFVNDYPIWYHMAHLYVVLNKIKVIKIKYEKIKECNMHNDGILPSSGALTGIPSMQTWTSDVSQVVVGFEEETNIIIDELTCGHKSLDIISIVGMAGLGKTTLARKVYNAPLVKSHFHIFAFCSVSRDQNAKRLFIDILSNIIVIDDISGMTEEDLAHQLRKCLSGQKYLIVMDDMWEIKAWDDVKSSFPDNQNGSRVMFTTRSNKVALEAQIKCSPYHLGFLSDEKSWELLQKKVFPNGSCSTNFSNVGKLIAKSCKGLPLAVVVIAGLLARTKPSLSWWSEIAERISSYLLEEGCMSILEFSYKHLPEYLKPMLLYFGAFPEDTLISVKSLMLLWIDEGFVHESKNKILEDVAKDYLRDLVDRSLIIVTDTSSNGGVKTVSIHDLIHDFCQIKAQAENFFQLRCGTASSSSSHNLESNHCRIYLQMAGETRVDDTETFPYVHSLLSFQRRNDPFEALSILGKFKLVQVLHLDNRWLEEYELEHVSLLVHLRHIAALVNHLVSVPSSVSNLWSLETFILRTMRKGEILLPVTIWKMKWLRHVNISRCRLIFPGGEKHVVYSQLNNVQSFSSPTLSTGKDLEELLNRLPAVRKLSCCFDKSRDSVDKRVETLDFLNELESLNLSYIGDRSPYVINFPSTLKKLKLVGLMLPWTFISVIGKLQHLEVLKLLWNSFVGPRWEMDDVEFPNLKFLKLNALNLVRWNAFPDSFPCLEQLLVIGCEDLVEIPACFGVIPTLKRFEVHDCNKKAASSAIEVKNEQMELGNDSLEVGISNSY